MTAEDNKHDDAEFEAFLQGQGDLARKLRRLPQPSPSADLDAAILAQAEALTAAAVPVREAANDAPPPKTGKPGKPRWRWNTQLALAASVVLATLVTLRWQNEPVVEPAEPARKIEQPEQVAQAPQAEAPPPAAPAAAPPPPAAGKQRTAPQPARPKPARQEPPPAASAPAQAKAEAGVADSNPQLGAAETATRQNYAAAPEQLARKETPDSRVRAIVIPVPKVAAAPEPSVPAPVVAPAKPEASTKAEAWLSVIEEMIKAGLRRDALDEWEKFNQAYPGYPVPEKLSTQIKALEK
ncbi:MAG: hypothetical protein JWQ61_4080 [Collimonas fungivorans]|uniref:hypothetical protein n=1 Tax=Collimonas fungivorans TaxID=158899 RepID=UPI0026F258C7|nr:hypothetical protein [Collimonas fungivorans]MDB5769266.1 hypothetical protein [Collimonas fungivorans]